MRFIGLDLAWGERARTGVAALDDAGHLVTCACVTTDDEIAAFAAEHAPGYIITPRLPGWAGDERGDSLSRPVA